MAHFFNAGAGKISREDWLRVAHQHGVPCFNDAAADVPPISNLWKYTQMGFDLVTFSGGKGMRGPQCTGLLLGRKDLIEAAKKNNSPNSNTIGRGMKVAKEEIVGLVAAVACQVLQVPAPSVHWSWMSAGLSWMTFFESATFRWSFSTRANQRSIAMKPSVAKSAWPSSGTGPSQIAWLAWEPKLASIA